MPLVTNCIRLCYKRTGKSWLYDLWDSKIEILVNLGSTQSFETILVILKKQMIKGTAPKIKKFREKF